MKVHLTYIGIFLILASLILAGCQEEGTTTDKKFENVFFESNVLKLVNGTFELRSDKTGIVTQAYVELRFKNILDKDINVTYAVDFCDKNDNIIYSKNYSINYFPAGYTEQLSDPFSYSGEDVMYVDHINIRLLEYKIIR